MRSSINPKIGSRSGSFASGTRISPTITSSTVYGILTRFEAKKTADDNTRSVNKAKTDVMLNIKNNKV